ncbi:hypothetical protein [Streptomyces sp. NPDC050264]|uniref:hypothetical protein n=1 Tax=Streptomyces sp. NPDC050264 TaxID=3155038 RepID=UPI00343579B4
MNRRRYIEAPPTPRGPGDVDRAASPAAAAFLAAGVIDGGTVEVISARAAEYVSKRAWHSLLGEQGKPGGCDELAEAARKLLELSEHSYVRAGVTGAVRRSGGSELMAQLAGELARHITLPLVGQLVLAARALQICGICVCVLQGVDLAHCACARDVTVEESQEQLRSLMAGALQDWQDLPGALGQ